MCLICTEYSLSKLTRKEAYQALTEMFNTKLIKVDHIREVIELIEETDKTKDSSNNSDKG